MVNCIKLEPLFPQDEYLSIYSFPHVLIFEKNFRWIEYSFSIALIKNYMLKYLRNFLLFLSLFLLIGIIGGIFFIQKNTFQLTEWKYPPKQEIIPNKHDRPNILLLVAEDMSARVGAFDDEIAHTPNIDQLALRGVRYPNTFTTAGVCSPSRAALITGMHQIAIGGQHMRTATRPEGAYKCVPPPYVKAFPELLRQAGYFTFNTAKLDYQFSGAMPNSGPFTIWDAENDAKLWRSRQAGQPFFGMINILETHESGVFTPLGHRPNSLMHFILQFFRKLSTEKSPVTIAPEKVVLPPYYPNTPTIRKDIARHYENIAAMDVLVGDILERLEKDGLAESTIVIWTTDHGDGLPRAKRELYDSGIKVPMVVYYPEKFRPAGIQPEAIDSQLISFIDFAPTFLNLAKASIPKHLLGQNFMANDTINRAYIYGSRDRIDEVQDRQRAVRNHRFKYIRSWYPEQEGGHRLAFRDNMEMMKNLWDLKAKNQLTSKQLLWFQAPGAERLFDVQEDPFELEDLSKDTAYQTDLIQMRQALNNWLAITEDWSEIPENDMVDGFQPNGIIEKTPAPSIQQKEDLLTLSSEIEGASLGYQIDDGSWKIYIEPFSVDNFEVIKAKAIRYGWEESDVVELFRNSY